MGIETYGGRTYRTVAGKVKKALRLIPEKFRRKGLAVACLIPLTAILNILGVALLFPMIYVVLDGGETFGNSFLHTIMVGSGFQDKDRFLICLVAATVLFIILKNLLVICAVRFQTGYLLALFRHFSSSLFSDLYDRGLLYMRSSNTSELTFNVNAACYNFATGYLFHLFKFWGDVLFCLLMMTALSFYDIGALAAVTAAFLPVVLFYVLPVRRKLKSYGRQEFSARRRQMKTVQETFRGYAEMKVNEAFSSMNGKFESGLEEISRFRIRTNILQSIPSRLLELAVALVLGGMVLMNIDASQASRRIFLGIFTVIIIRMLPVVISLINTWNSMKNTEYTIDVISQLSDMTCRKSDKDTAVIPFTFTESIKAENISFSFPDRQMFRNLSFEIRRGERFGIRGKTGAGKSTLFNLLLGLINPEEGEIFIDGNPLKGDFIRRWHSAVGYVSQEVFISDTTIAENIALGVDRENIDRQRLDDAIDKACLRTFVDSLPHGADTGIGEAGSRISGGQRQRIGIARALYKGAQVLFFDEATSSLDVQTESEINREIQKLSSEDRHLTIIIISHRPGSLEFCGRTMEI